jgi:hypothetical protein
MSESPTHAPGAAHEGSHPPTAPHDDPATVDAEKTFKIIAISAVLFVLAMAFIILRTRLG